MSAIEKLKGQTVIVIGLLINSIGLLTKLFSDSVAVSCFVSGFCLGLSVMLIVAGIVKIRKEKATK